MSIQALTEINLDLNAPFIVTVNAKQYDTARQVKAHLYNGNVKWEVPSSDYVAIVSFKKPHRSIGISSSESIAGIGGFYDETEDGIKAVSVDSSDRSVVTILLDRNVLSTESTSSSPTRVEITFYDVSGDYVHRLSTFAFNLAVQASVLTELDLAADPSYKVLAQEIKAVLDAEANLTGITATASGRAAGASPTVTVTGGSSGAPYNLAFGIPKGDTGSPPTPNATPSNTFAVSSSGTTVPSSGWSSTPTIAPGKYLWTRSVTTWNTGTTTAYSVGYIGQNGSGSTAAEIATSTAGENVQEALDYDDILYTLSSYNGATTTRTSSNASEALYYLTADHVVSQITLSNRFAQNGDWTITTTAHGFTITGAATSGQTTDVTILFTKVKS